jgi:hypothetical protein
MCTDFRSFTVFTVFRSFRSFPQFSAVSAVSGSPVSAVSAVVLCAIDHTEGLLFVSPSLIEERRSGMVFLSMMRNGLESEVFRMMSMSSARVSISNSFAGGLQIASG